MDSTKLFYTSADPGVVMLFDLLFVLLSNLGKSAVYPHGRSRSLGKLSSVNFFGTFVSGANIVPKTYYRLKTYPLSEMPPVGICTAAFSGHGAGILFTVLCLWKHGCQAIRDSRLILMALVKWNLLVNSQQGLNRAPLLPPDSTRHRASPSHLEIRGVGWW